MFRHNYLRNTKMATSKGIVAFDKTGKAVSLDKEGKEKEVSEDVAKLLDKLADVTRIDDGSFTVSHETAKEEKSEVSHETPKKPAKKEPVKPKSATTKKATTKKATK